MTSVSRANLLSHLNGTNASRHVCSSGGEAAAFAYRHDIHAGDKDLAGNLTTSDSLVLVTKTRSGCEAVRDGFGPVLLEAQAAGTPLIAPAYGGSREAYAGESSGMAASAGSVGAPITTLPELLKELAWLAWRAGQAVRLTRQAFAPGHYAQLAVRRLL